MRKEPVPEIGFGNRIVGPIAYLVIFEDYSRFLIFLGIMRPHIVITPRVSRRCSARFLKPDMLIASVVQYELGDHAQAVFVGSIQKALKIIQRPIGRVYGEIIGDVVSIVLEG